MNALSYALLFSPAIIAVMILACATGFAQSRKVRILCGVIAALLLAAQSLLFFVLPGIGGHGPSRTVGWEYYQIPTLMAAGSAALIWSYFVCGCRRTKQRPNSAEPCARAVVIDAIEPSPSIEPQDKNRDCSLASGCKDLIDAIRLQVDKTESSLPAITRRVVLPEVVSVRYLAELLGLNLDEMHKLSGYTAPRSMPFKEAQRILRQLGICAEKASS